LYRRLIHIVYLVLCPLFVTAQEYRLDLIPAGGESIKGILPDNKSAPDSIQAYRMLRDYLGEMQGMGYLAASADSILFDSAGARAYIWSGPRLSWGNLSLDSISPEALRNTRIRPGKFKGRFVEADRIADARSKLVAWYEDRGYPFVSVQIENARIRGNRIEGELRVEPSGLFLVDSLLIKGDVKVQPSYLQKLTGIIPGQPYSEKNIRNISSRIRETMFLEEIRPPELEFFEGGVDVYTYLEKRKSSRFNGIIGMLPEYEKTGRLLVTGELDLQLVNTLGYGESFYFGWRSPQPRSQELEIDVGWPYLFSTGFGMGITFDLLKQDTSYLSLNPVLDLRFFLGGGSYLHAFIDHFSSSLISTSSLQNAVTLPPSADVSGSLYGLGLRYSSLDYPLNPSRGWDIEAGLGMGSRRIRKNSSLPQQVYEGVDLNTTKLRSTARISFFQPLAGRFVLHLSGKAGYLRNDYLFENELFRLGGMNSFRGVDENSILASGYGFGTFETRFLFEQGSAIYLFLDGGYYEKALEDEFVSDTPLGFGAGLQLNTAAGIFLLNYALGRQFDNPLNIGKAKIHIGYQNRF